MLRGVWGTPDGINFSWFVEHLNIWDTDLYLINGIFGYSTFFIALFNSLETLVVNTLQYSLRVYEYKRFTVRLLKSIQGKSVLHCLHNAYYSAQAQEQFQLTSIKIAGKNGKWGNGVMRTRQPLGLRLQRLHKFCSGLS